MVIELAGLASALRSGCGSRQRLAPVALKVAQILQVIMSIEQLIEAREASCGHPCGSFDCDILEKGRSAHRPHGVDRLLA